MKLADPGLLDSSEPHAVTEIAAPQRLTVCASEQKTLGTFGGKPGQVPAQLRDDHIRYGYDPLARISLGCPEREPGTPRLCQLTGDPHHPSVQIDVTPPQGCEFAPSQAAEAGQQDQDAVSLDRKSTRLNSSHVEIS